MRLNDKIRSLATLLVSLVCVITIGGCTEARLAVYGAKQMIGPDSGDVQPPYKVGSPYQMAGQWYYPEENPAYDHVGMASWYGPKFHGSLTANGEIYDMDGMTAAHTTLPMPSWVRVTNLENGRSVLVRINDRGPFKKNRIIDLSRKAAQQLDMIGNGTANVRVTMVQTGGPNGRLVRPQWLESSEGHANAPLHQVAGKGIAADEISPTAMPAGNVVAVSLAADGGAATTQQPIRAEGPRRQAHLSPHYIQVGAFMSRESAERLQSRMTSLFGGAVTKTFIQNGQSLHKVWVGPYRSLDSAAGALASLQDTGYSGAHIVRPTGQTQSAVKSSATR